MIDLNKWGLYSLIALFLLFSTKGESWAQQRRAPRTSYHAFSIGYGGAYITDKTLSPLPYGGNTLSIAKRSERLLQKSFPEWIISTDGSFNYGSVFNPARNAAMRHLRVEYSPAILHLFSTPSHWVGGLGGGMRFLGGVRLHSRNGNNPAVVDALASFTVNGLLAYRLPLKEFPMAIRLTAGCSLFGFASALGYGQSYYEWVVDERATLRSLLFTSPLNNNYFATQLTVDIPLGDFCTLQLGYRGNFERTSFRGVVRSQVLHVPMVGFSFEALTYHGRRTAFQTSHKTTLFDTPLNARL